MGEIIDLSEHEELQETAPSRPGVRDAAVIVRAFCRYAPEFRKATGASEPEHEEVLILRLVQALQLEQDPWQVSKVLALKGWPMDAELYQLLLGFIRHLETCRIELEMEWVMRNGVRFPAKEQQRVSFRAGSSRYIGTVEAVDRPRARGIVRRVKTAGGAVVAVNAEDVLMIMPEASSG